MRAAIFERYGPPEVLHLADLPDVAAGPGQVRVRRGDMRGSAAAARWS